MNKNKLLSIGQLSKQTGVHIGSLRYYDQLGILPPVYVDDQSGYRYYSFPQIYVVEAIQFCVELEIPLKEFRWFSQNGAGKINFLSLIEQGRILANEKIRVTEEKLCLLQQLQSEIEHAERCALATKPLQCEMREKHCWTVPYPHPLSQDKCNALYGKMILDLSRHKMRAGYEIGILGIWSDESIEQFLYIELAQPPPNILQFQNVIVLPAGRYLCMQSTTNDVMAAPLLFSNLFAQTDKKIIISRELFTNENDFFNPVFELCCSLSEKDKEWAERVLGL